MGLFSGIITFLLIYFLHLKYISPKQFDLWWCSSRVLHPQWGGNNLLCSQDVWSQDEEKHQDSTWLHLTLNFQSDPIFIFMFFFPGYNSMCKPLHCTMCMLSFQIKVFCFYVVFILQPNPIQVLLDNSRTKNMDFLKYLQICVGLKLFLCGRFSVCLRKVVVFFSNQLVIFNIII